MGMSGRSLRLIGSVGLAALSAAAIQVAGVSVASATPSGNGGANGGGWSVSYYSPNGVSLGATVALGSTRPVEFPFLPPEGYVALLQGGGANGLTGDLTGKTLTDAFTITGMNPGATFVGNSDQCTPNGNPPSARLYFATGHSVSRYNLWWADVSAATLTGNASGSMSASLANPGDWSDLYGDSGAAAPSEFAAAAANVTVVGVSFGDGCHFENGVTTSDGSGYFSSDMAIS